MSMMKKKRWTTEAQVIAAIDRANELELKDTREIAQYEAEIAQLKAAAAAEGEQWVDGLNFRRAKIMALKKRMARRGSGLRKLKDKLGEIRTMTLPLTVELMSDKSIRK